MTLRFFTLFFMMLAFSAGAMFKPALAADLSVNALRIGTHPDKERMVVELSRKTDFRVFLLQNPTRIVIDLPAFDWRAGQPSCPPGSLVGAIRNGALEPGISRIVVDLQQAATIKSAFVLPSGTSIPDRLVIDFSKAPAGYSPSGERMFGSLKSGAGQTAATTAMAPAQTLKIPETAGAGMTETAAPAPRPSGKGPKPLIVIDPGHGGNDPGALGANGKKEKDVTLAAAKDLKEALENTGRYRVHLTRSTDTFIKLQERVAIARKKGADLFISLHADSIDKPNVSGASIYTLSNKASDAQTAKLAARENRADLIAGVDLSHEDKEVANILIDLAMRDTMNQSKFFANTVVKHADNKGVHLLEKPHRFAGFAVLKAPDIPSVLIEMGFMSNSREVSQLSSPAYRKKIAASIVAGVDAYFAKVQKSGQN